MKKKPTFEITGILYEPELHFIPRKYFAMACELSEYMEEHNLRDIQGLTLSSHYRKAVNTIAKTHELRYLPKKQG